jgi:hypothetical protein
MSLFGSGSWGGSTPPEGIVLWLMDFFGPISALRGVEPPLPISNGTKNFSRLVAAAIDEGLS